jgi:hypothetical protein
MSGVNHSAFLARGFLSHMSETSSASDALYRTILNAGAFIPRTGPEPSVELILSVAKSASPEDLAALVRLVRSPETLDALVRARQSKQVWREASRHENLSLATAEYLARRSSRLSVSDNVTFMHVAAHPEISVKLIVDYVRENPGMACVPVNERLGRNAAARPDQWSALLNRDATDVGLIRAQALLIGNVEDRSAQLELLERITPSLQSKLVSVIFEDAALARNFDTFDVLHAKLLLAAQDQTDLREWTDKPMGDDVVRMLFNSDRLVAHRMLLHSFHTPDDIRLELVRRIERQYAPDAQPSLQLYPTPTIHDLVNAARGSVFGHGLLLRVLRLVESVDINRWSYVRSFAAGELDPDLTATVEGRELLGYLADTATMQGAPMDSWQLNMLLKFEELSAESVANLLRHADQDSTHEWFAAAAKRRDPARIVVLEALMDEPGNAFGYRGYRSSYWNSSLSREELYQMYLPSIISPTDTELIDWVMNSCEGVLVSTAIASSEYASDWLAASCAAAGVSPEQGYEVLLSLLPEWEGTPRELVDTVAAVA